MGASSKMSIEAVRKYMYSDINLPYFLVVGDDQYKDVKDKLTELGLTFIRLSDYCSDDDKLPDVDSLFERLKTANSKPSNNKLVVIGLGEYLALRGNDVATNILSRLKDLNIGTAKVIFLLRGVADQINSLKTDLRFDRRRFIILEKADCNLSLTLATSSVGLSALSGIKSLLIKLENGSGDHFAVNTSVNLDNALFSIRKITNSYDGIKFISNGFNMPHSCGSDEQWGELLTELDQNDNSINAVFEKNGFSSNYNENIYSKIAGNGYRNWLYFIFLKSNVEKVSNSYLRFVLDKTDRFENFKTNLLNAIIEISHTDKRFSEYYTNRKTLTEKFPESDIANFVIANRKNISESVYRLTDGTKPEREEIIAWVSQNGVIPQIANIYPALIYYLNTYLFNCGELSELLTEYFDDYKRQKISNNLEPDFLEKVERIAKSRDYNRLPTRNELIEGINKTDTYLYWLDALGVEYLAFIAEQARLKGLSVNINIARAELPTITSINRDFFDDWQDDNKEKNNELDEIKHRDEGGYNFKNNVLPIHLAKELDIITNVMEKAATELAKRNYKRFLIVSDHGASRLAVLRRKEEQYEADAKGEHSGRCCELLEPYDLPFAAKENGYLVLADYGRFKGSRAASVEVHGGASLEEVVIPIIELSLKDNNIIIELVDELVTADFRTGAEITLFSKSHLKDVTIIFKNKRYITTQIDNNHYKAVISDINRAGDYTVDVYEGDDLISKLNIKAQGKSGKINNAFEDLF